MHSLARAVHNAGASVAHRLLPQWLCAIIFLSVSARAATVVFPLHNSAGSAAYLTEVDLQPCNFPVVGSTNYTIIGDTIPYFTDATGMLVVSNLETNYYMVTQHGFTTNTVWFISVPNFSATYTNPMVAFTNAVSDGTMAYSILQANNTFVSQANAGNNLTATTNWVNGLQVVTLNSTGGGGSFSGDSTQFGTNAAGAVTIVSGAKATNFNAVGPFTNIGNATVSGNVVSATGAFGVGISPTYGIGGSGTGTPYSNPSSLTIGGGIVFAESSYASTPALTGNNLSDLASAATARANLGLGTAATANLNYFVSSTNGNGGTITNLPMLSIKRDFGAKGGTNNDTAAFQAALNSAAPVEIWDFPSYTVSNLFGTNGSTLVGYNTVLNFNTGATGYAISNSESLTNLVFYGIIFDGQQIGFTGSGDASGSYPWTFSPSGQLTGTAVNQSASVNRSGIYIASHSSNSVIANCTFRNFSDAGLRVYSTVTFPQPFYGQTQIQNCNFALDWIGLHLQDSAEYITIQGCQAQECGWGLYTQAGNHQINGWIFTRNGGAVIVNGAANNPAHGSVSDSLLNHNDMPFMCENFANTESFTGDHIEGGGPMASTVGIYNCDGVTFSEGVISSLSTVVVYGTGGTGGYNEFSRNIFYGGPPIIVITNSGVLVTNWNSIQGQTNGVEYISSATGFTSSTNQFSGLTVTGNSSLADTVTGSNSTAFTGTYSNSVTLENVTASMAMVSDGANHPTNATYTTAAEIDQMHAGSNVVAGSGMTAATNGPIVTLSSSGITSTAGSAVPYVFGAPNITMPNGTGTLPFYGAGLYSALANSEVTARMPVRVTNIYGGVMRFYKGSAPANTTVWQVVPYTNGVLSTNCWFAATWNGSLLEQTVTLQGVPIVFTSYTNVITWMPSNSSGGTVSSCYVFGSFVGRGPD